MESRILSMAELPEVARELLSYAGDEKVFLFYGDMGAGKTTFIKSLCLQLGIHDTVSSPTFSIVNEYESVSGPVYHFDFYRLKSEGEAFDLGYEDYFYSGLYCFVEWPEKIPSLIPDHFVSVKISAEGETERLISAVKQ